MERVEQALSDNPGDEDKGRKSVMTKKKPEPDRAGLMSAVGRTLGINPKSEIDEQSATPGYVVPPSRRNKVGILTHHDQAVAYQLKALALRERKTQQKLVAEALNMLFAKYHLNQIA